MKCGIIHIDRRIKIPGSLGVKEELLGFAMGRASALGVVGTRGGLVRGRGECQPSTHCSYKRKMREPKESLKEKDERA